MNDLLQIAGLTKQYNDFKLKQVSFSLAPGYIMGLIGQNGAGKTTTIQLILNMVKKQSGVIKIFGLDHQKDEKKVKQDIAVIFDELCFVKDWNLKEVEKAYKVFYEKWDTKKYYEHLERFGMNPRMKVKDLSRGMGVKLMLAAAFSHDAKLLILDEPTSGLDPGARDELMELLQEYVEEGTRSILFSTHITSDLEKVADYITCIHQGEIYYSGEKDGLLEKYTLLKGEKELYAQYSPFFISARKFETRFEALVLTKDVALIQKAQQVNHDKKVLFETPSIEEIMVLMSRKG
jgi:ABC-2 type transport system ATP-binding protein